MDKDSYLTGWSTGVWMAVCIETARSYPDFSGSQILWFALFVTTTIYFIFSLVYK